MGRFWLVAVCAAVLSLVWTPIVAALARRWGVVDRPGGRRWHTGDVPKLGGIALLLSTGGALAIAARGGFLAPELIQATDSSTLWLVAGLVAIVVLGAVDDAIELGPLTKLAVQVVAAVAVVAAGYGFRAVTNPFTGGVIALGPLGPCFTVLWLVGITNAFNLIDGLDGLAAGVALIAAVTLTGISFLEGRPEAAFLWMTLAGALVGFLFYNFHPAKIFLGDSGSLFLGFVLAVLSVQSLQKGATAVVLSVPILALGLPIADTAHALARRSRFSGAASVFRADHEHIHHRLVRVGTTQRRAVLILYAICIALSGLAFLAVTVRGPLEAVLVGAAAVAGYYSTRRLDREVGAAERIAPGDRRGDDASAPELPAENTP